MAQTELEKTLKRMKVTIKVTEQAGTPARGFMPNARPWRVMLSRENKDDDKPLRLTFVILSPNEPDLSMAMQALAGDIEGGDMSPWEFAQEFNKGKIDPGAERMHRTCKQTANRVRRLLGNSWSLIMTRVMKAA